MKFLRLSILILVALVFASCRSSVDEFASETVATVDGEVITQLELARFVEENLGILIEDIDAEQKQRALDSLILLHILANQAERDGLSSDPDIAQKVELSRLNLLQQALVDRYLADTTLTDQMLIEEYDRQVAQLPPKEYRARHILVASREEADQILSRINNGESFESLASESLDSSRDQGGDLGWFNVNSMIKPFADAVLSLREGELLASPIETEFGWHLIRVDETRDIEPPPFEEVKEELRQALLAAKIRSLADKLMTKMKIEKLASDDQPVTRYQSPRHDAKVDDPTIREESTATSKDLNRSSATLTEAGVESLERYRPADTMTLCQYRPGGCSKKKGIPRPNIDIPRLDPYEQDVGTLCQYRRGGCSTVRGGRDAFEQDVGTLCQYSPGGCGAVGARFDRYPYGGR